jgi:hypothetical protein
VEEEADEEAEEEGGRGEGARNTFGCTARGGGNVKWKLR